MNCARNIVTANFSGGGTSATTAPLWQWDYGQVLCVTGIEDLPTAFEVHFSTNRTGGSSTVAVGADGQVTIPNVMLTIGKNLNAWIYLSDAQGEGETEYSILIPVKARPMPETYDAEVTGEFDDVVRQVSEYAQTAQTAADNAGASATAAAASADSAAASASAAETAKTAAETAQGKAEDAQAAAETAAQTATEKAQQTAQDATQAAQSKADAESAAQRAEAAQTGAESAKTDAETAAQSAADSASAASTSATGAGQAASAAAQSASAAAGSATTAGNAAQTATTKAGEAFASADAAAASETAAQTAQTAAETAATNAGQSASTATTKAAEAAQSASNAAASETAAEAAATRAEQAAASLTVDDALSDTSENPVQNKVVTESVTQLKNALNECFYNINGSASLWEQGTISTLGNESSSSISIRTDTFLAKNIVAIEPASGWKFMLYAWNATTGAFVGIYKNGTFVATTNWLTGNLLISGLQNYNLRVVARKTDESAITPADFAGMRLLVTVDNTLTKEFVPADAKTTGERISAHDSELTILENSVDNLDEATFVYAYSQKTLAEASILKTGFSASISGGNTIGLGANANYDTYYWFAEKDTKLYIDASSVSYAAICIGVSPTTSDFVWASTSATLTCQSAYRVRKSESNLPTADNPIVISKGTAIVITVTTTKTCPVYLWEKTVTAKVDTIISGGVTCNIQTNSVTITGESYEVVFSKLTTMQGYQWNINSLSGKDGVNMFPAGVDIIGVIQFVGGSNFMGGVHGNESNYEFRVMADGADVSGAVVKDEIHIIMSSHLYDPDNTANNVVDRFVEFVFTTKGWTCRNTFKVLVNAQIQVAYPSGLFAFTASDADGAYSNVGTLNLSSTSARQLESADFKEITINLPGKFTLNIQSETAEKGWVTYRSNTTSFKVYFANAELETVTAGAFISGKCEYRF